MAAVQVNVTSFSCFQWSTCCFTLSLGRHEKHLIKRLSSGVFEPRTEFGSGYFACQDISLAQIVKLIVSTSEKILNNINVVV